MFCFEDFSEIPPKNSKFKPTLNTWHFMSLSQRALSYVNNDN